MKKSKFKKLLSGMCCSVCGRDFDEDSVTVLRGGEENNSDGLFVLKIRCAECGKSFGIAFLGTGEESIKDDDPLEFKPCPAPVSYDDVLDAHNFIDKLEKDWTKYIPDNLKN